MAHYASLGPLQRQRVDDVYRRLLREIEHLPAARGAHEHGAERASLPRATTEPIA
jgi:hypothetical protein